VFRNYLEGADTVAQPIHSEAIASFRGRFSLAFDPKNFLSPAENFVQLRDSDESSHTAVGGITVSLSCVLSE
jgi:hypothetical protein